jgi:hypothetical protein
VGLAAQIRWERSRSNPPECAAAAATDDSAKGEATVSDLTESNLRWLRTVIRVGTIATALFQAARILQVIDLNLRMSRPIRPAELGIHLLIVIVSCLAFALSFGGWFARHWRAMTLTLCMALTGFAAAVNLMHRESAPMFVETLLLLVGAGALVPWGEQWQAALSAFCVPAFAVDQALVPMADQHLYLRWLGMSVGVLVAQIAVHLTGAYRRDLAQSFEEL